MDVDGPIAEMEPPRPKWLEDQDIADRVRVRSGIVRVRRRGRSADVEA